MFDFDMFFGETTDVIFEQYVGNQIVNRQVLSAPPEILKTQFMNAMNEIANEKGRQPLKIKMIRYEEIWDSFERKRRKIENSIEFKNWED